MANPEQVGRYRVLERVGRGGMGVLYRGVDPVLDREVAIKLMLADFSEDTEQMRPRFYREARAAAKLQHRNIVTIFEFAEEGSTPYIVMEFLRGTSLAARMTAAPPLTLDEKLEIMAQLCAGLHYAHEQGIVHRDVKPANIFLLTDGTVKLLDFGIAKLTTSTLTRQGDVLGSASYMSPEQVSGSESVDGRADIFSTGVVMYELLAGRKPFQADAPTAIIMKILHEDPPALDGLVAGLPAQLVAAVNRALAKDPAHRFRTAGELRRELEWIRKAMQASGEQGASLLDETKFAPTEIIRSLHPQPAGTESSRRPASQSSNFPNVSGGLGTAPISSLPAALGTSEFSRFKLAEVARGLLANRQWLVPGGIAAAVVATVITAVLFGRASMRQAQGATPGVTTGGTHTTPPSNMPVKSTATELGPKSSVKSIDTATAPAAGSRSSAAPLAGSRPRPGAQTPATTAGANAGFATAHAPGGPPVIAGQTVRIMSEPPGAAIAVDGKTWKQPTPASVIISGSGAHTLKLSKRGFQPLEVRVGDADIRGGSLDYQLTGIEEASVPVVLTGDYPFEVFVGSKMISAASQSHELKVGAGRTVRLVAPDFFLDQTMTVEGPAGQRFERKAPGLARLSVRSNLEQCEIALNGRNLHRTPPLNDLRVAAGQHKVEMVCPDGQTRSQLITVFPGTSPVAKILK